jgi:uncharacterized protein (TIGR00661 family)
MKKGEVDILISGDQADVTLPFTVKYQLKGLSFTFGKKGGVDLLHTYQNMDTAELSSNIADIPVEEYDVVINDFEPVTAWACKQKGIPCIALSHQCAVLAKNAPQPINNDFVGRAILKYYAPSTDKYGFHFGNYQKNIFTPVIRSEVRSLVPSDENHYTVYLPSYDDERIFKNLSGFKGIIWDVFSKHNKKVYKEGNMRIRPIENTAFLKSMASASGIICGAGFETPAEALFLQKKLLVIPMKGQYEQQCNAAALSAMGVPVMKSLKKKHHYLIYDWLVNGKAIPVHYPDITEKIINAILNNHHYNKNKPFVLSNKLLKFSGI